ncbi:MAG: hypothetical protein ACKOCM_00835 [Cyanobacteriota bacterium]
MLSLPLEAVSDPLNQLQQLVVSESLAALLAAPPIPSVQALRDLNLELLNQQSQALASPQRVLTLEVLRFLQLHQPAPHQAMPLLLACLRAGRFADLLQLQEQWAPHDPEARQLRLVAAYRLGDWREVCSLAAIWQPRQLPFELLRMAARANLELGVFCAVDPLLEAMQSITSSSSQRQQLEVLRLWRAFLAGLAGPPEAEGLLQLLPQLDSSEAACVLRFWPQLGLLLESSRSSLPAVARLQRRLRHRIGLPAMLATPAGPLPALPECTGGWRVALVLAEDDPAARQLVDALQQGMAQVLPELALVPVLLHGSVHFNSVPAGWLDLSAQTPLQRLALLREGRFDVLLDTVGPADPFWLRSLCQGLAPLQLAWFATVQPLPSAAPYRAQLADRWTVPAEPAAGEVPWLTLTGVRQLSPAPLTPPPVPPDAEVALVLLGAPAALLPGAGRMLHRCLAELPVQALWFAHAHWQDPDLLPRWWQTWLGEPLPARCRPGNPEAAAGQRLIALDLSLESPTRDAALWLGEGRPVVTLPVASPSARGVAGLLSALGLPSLAQEQPQLWLEAVAALVHDAELHGQIHGHLREHVAGSLLCDRALLARDLVEAIRVLRSAEEHAL